MDILEQIRQIIDDRNYALASEQCTGLPYLPLMSGDYVVSLTQTTYQDLTSLLRQCSASAKWQSNHVDFFNIQPIFVNGKPIRGVLGLHLALIILSKNLAIDSTPLYFDINSVIKSKQLRLLDSRPYFVASWLAINRSSLFGEEIDTGDGYIKTAIQLFQTIELESVNLKAPTLESYSQKLKEHHSDLSEQQILDHSVQLFLEYFQDDLRRKPHLTKTSIYIYVLTFCREFALNRESFFTTLLAHDISGIDVQDDLEIINIINVCFEFMEYVHLEIGEITQDQINHEQRHIGLFDVVDEDEKSKIKTNTDTNPNDADIITITETQGTGIYEINKRYYEMERPFNENEAVQYYQAYYKSLILLFYQNGINKIEFNRIKLTYDSTARSDILNTKVLELQNRPYQMSLIKDIVYLSFEHHHQLKKYDLLLMQRLLLPSLDRTQTNQINLLNETDKMQFMEDFWSSAEEILLLSISLVQKKLSHKDYKPFMAEKIAKLSDSNIATIIYEYYCKNYIEAYLTISNMYDYILSQIKQDISIFESNLDVGVSVICEINYFSAVKKNPRTILDLNII